jgi:hypothetical protein
MNVDTIHVITFVTICMIIQYSLCVCEGDYYANMVSDIQGHKANFYKNEKNEFIIRNIFIFTILYIGVAIFYYYYIVIPKKSLTESVVFGVILYGAWDFAIYSCFNKATYHLPVLLYDMFIVGGVGLSLAYYITTNYYQVLKNYTPLLIVLYFLSMILFLYKAYLYNTK